MTAEEFSNEFDVFLASYKRFKGYDPMDYPDSLEFDEYEKSVFLTKAQEYIVRELYDSGSTEHFEGTEHNRRYLDSLVKTKKMTEYVSDTVDLEAPDRLPDKYSHFVYKLPDRCWFIVYEQVTLTKGGDCANTVAEVIPIPHDNYIRATRDPFKRPSGRKVLRLDKGDRQVEIVTKRGSEVEYIIRYVSRPYPILLVNLQDTDLTVDDEKTVMTCKLAEPLHRLILEQAVKFAYESKIKETKTKDSK